MSCNYLYLTLKWKLPRSLLQWLWAFAAAIALTRRDPNPKVTWQGVMTAAWPLWISKSRCPRQPPSKSPSTKFSSGTNCYTKKLWARDTGPDRRSTGVHHLESSNVRDASNCSSTLAIARWPKWRALCRLFYQDSTSLASESAPATNCLFTIGTWFLHVAIWKKVRPNTFLESIFKGLTTSLAEATMNLRKVSHVIKLQDGIWVCLYVCFILK